MSVRRAACAKMLNVNPNERLNSSKFSQKLKILKDVSETESVSKHS